VLPASVSHGESLQQQQQRELGRLLPRLRVVQLGEMMQWQKQTMQRQEGRKMARLACRQSEYLELQAVLPSTWAPKGGHSGQLGEYSRCFHELVLDPRLQDQDRLRAQPDLLRAEVLTFRPAGLISLYLYLSPPGCFPVPTMTLLPLSCALRSLLNVAADAPLPAPPRDLPAF